MDCSNAVGTDLIGGEGVSERIKYLATNWHTMPQGTADSPEDQPELDAESEDDPDIEEDLLREELRIDGICGVY
jgi:mycofactocin precursor